MTSDNHGQFLISLIEAESRLLNLIAETVALGLPIDRQRFDDVLRHTNAARRLLGLKLKRWPVENKKPLAVTGALAGERDHSRRGEDQ